MGVLDDTAIFTAVIQQGGFSRAAKYLGLSNGLISRRIAQLESQLGVTLIKRTTRQLQLTPEGELFWQHAQRIQQELESALTLIQSGVDKPKGTIRISAPLYFGRHYLTPILIKFMNSFPEIKLDLILTNQRLDPIKENLDLIIRASGALGSEHLKDSSMRVKLLTKQKTGLYASPDYLIKYGEPKSAKDLPHHTILSYTDGQLSDKMIWEYEHQNNKETIALEPKFNCNDTESCLVACALGYGIGKFPVLFAKRESQNKPLRQILTQYDWGNFHLYAIYAQQETLPKRTRVVLDFINAHTQCFSEKRNEVNN